MTTILRFPQERTHRQQILLRDQQLSEDPYYQFLKNVMVLVNDCGFKSEKSVEVAAQSWYERHRHISPLANALTNTTPQE